MLRQFLSDSIGAEVVREGLGGDGMMIKSFNLLCGGVARAPASQEPSVDERFSEILLESMKLLLDASLKRKQQHEERAPEIKYSDGDQLTTIHRLIEYLDELRKSGKVKMGGYFPQVIAQKSISLVQCTLAHVFLWVCSRAPNTVSPCVDLVRLALLQMMLDWLGESDRSVNRR